MGGYPSIAEEKKKERTCWSTFFEVISIRFIHYKNKVSIYSLIHLCDLLEFSLNSCMCLHYH